MNEVDYSSFYCLNLNARRAKGVRTIYRTVNIFPATNFEGRMLVEKLTVPQLINEFRVLHETLLTFITCSINPAFVPSFSQLNPIKIPKHRF